MLNNGPLQVAGDFVLQRSGNAIHNHPGGLQSYQADSANIVYIYNHPLTCNYLIVKTLTPTYAHRLHALYLCNPVD